MSKLYDTFDLQNNALTTSHGAGNVIYVLNRGNTNRQIQIVAHTTNASHLSLPTPPPIVNDNNSEVSIETINKIVELEICLAPFKVLSDWDLTCTGAQYDLAFEIDKSKTYWLQHNNDGNYIQVNGNQLSNHLNSLTPFTSFTDANPPAILTEINCVPNDLGYRYSDTLTTNTDKGIILMYQVDDLPPKVYRTQTTTDLGSMNTTKFMNAFIDEFNAGQNGIRIRRITNNLSTTEKVANGEATYNFLLMNNVGDHLILPYGEKHATFLGMPATEENSMPKLLRFLKYPDPTYQSIEIKQYGQGGLVDIFPSMFDELTSVEIHSCGLSSEPVI